MSPPPAAPTTAHCPFCRKSISEDLLRFGGNCPHCLIEIPGEEAPTDPGAELRAAQKADEARAARKRSIGRALTTVAVLLLISASVGGYLLLRPEPPKLDPSAYQFEFEIMPLEAHEDLDYPELAPEQPATETSRGTTAVASAATTTPTASPSAGVAVAAPAPEASARTSEPSIASDPLEAFTVPVALGDRGPQAIVLTDPEQISEMIGRVLARGQAQITRCYETRLNSKPGLSGTWLVDFTVTTERTASDILVQGLDGSDSELERCITRAVERWEFMPVKDPVASGTKYRFAPRG